MKINSKDFRVPPGEKVNLRDWPTIVKPFRKSKEQYQELLREHVERHVMSGVNPQGCLQFLSGSSMRSRNRFRCSSFERWRKN